MHSALEADVMKRLDELGALIADGRKYLLKTEKPTYVDFTLATALSPLLFADEFGGGAIEPESVLRVEECGKVAGAAAKKARNTAIGKFALRIFKEHRHVKRRY